MLQVSILTHKNDELKNNKKFFFSVIFRILVPKSITIKPILVVKIEDIKEITEELKMRF